MRELQLFRHRINSDKVERTTAGRVTYHKRRRKTFWWPSHETFDMPLTKERQHTIYWLRFGVGWLTGQGGRINNFFAD